MQIPTWAAKINCHVCYWMYIVHVHVCVTIWVCELYHYILITWLSHGNHMTHMVITWLSHGGHMTFTGAGGVAQPVLGHEYQRSPGGHHGHTVLWWKRAQVGKWTSYSLLIKEKKIRAWWIWLLCPSFPGTWTTQLLTSCRWLAEQTDPWLTIAVSALELA